MGNKNIRGPLPMFSRVRTNPRAGPLSAEAGCILNATNLSPANDRSRGTWLVPLCGYDEWGACVWWIAQSSPEYGRDRASLRLDTVDYRLSIMQ